jgi:hypothetical protein
MAKMTGNRIKKVDEMGRVKPSFDAILFRENGSLEKDGR